MGDDGQLDAEQRGGDGPAEQVLIALIVRMGNQGDTGTDQLGPRGVDVDPLAIGPLEPNLVIGPALFPILQLGLGHGGLEVDVPQHRRVRGVGLAARQVADEGLLRSPATVVVDRGVGHLPVDRQPHSSP